MLWCIVLPELVPALCSRMCLLPSAPVPARIHWMMTGRRGWLVSGHLGVYNSERLVAGTVRTILLCCIVLPVLDTVKCPCMYLQPVFFSHCPVSVSAKWSNWSPAGRRAVYCTMYTVCAVVSYYLFPSQWTGLCLLPLLSCPVLAASGLLQVRLMALSQTRSVGPWLQAAMTECSAV